ncbi:MAG: hypothetical protein LBG98_02835 [Puniceicoccales bacterium]|nr:hypothetical protein [Puniceicoccales bacterium]
MAHIWGEETRAPSEADWFSKLDGWLTKVPLSIREQIHHIIIPSDALKFRCLNVPSVSKQNCAQAVDFELRRAMRVGDNDSTKWVSGFVTGFLKENDDDLPCFVTKYPFLGSLLELLARRYVSVRHVFIDSLLSLQLFESISCKEATLFVYAGAHVMTLCFRKGRTAKMMAIPYDYPGLLKKIQEAALACGSSSITDLALMQEVLAADPTTAFGVCGAQVRQHLHSKFKQAELALYREMAGAEFHRVVISAYDLSAYTLMERVWTDAGKHVISASEYFKFTWGRRVPKELQTIMEPSLTAVYGAVIADHEKASICYKDMIPLPWKADYFFTRAKPFILGTVLAASVFLLSGMMALRAGNKSLERERMVLISFQEEAMQIEKALAEANQQIMAKRKDSDRICALVRHQDAWLKWFDDVRQQLAETQALWFDALEWRPLEMPPRISVKGTLLTAEVLDSQDGDQQMVKFLQGMKNVSFAKDIQNTKLLVKDEFIIAFSFDLILDDKTPLSL